MSENDPYGSEGGARNERPYPYSSESESDAFMCKAPSCPTRGFAQKVRTSPICTRQMCNLPGDYRFSKIDNRLANLKFLLQIGGWRVQIGDV